MKLFLRLLRYVFPYKKNIVLIIFSNVLYSIFSVFSLTLIVPFLSVLFNQIEPISTIPELKLSMDSVINTYYYYMGQLVIQSGKESALVMIAISMIILSFLSNLFRYLGQFWLAPIRAGVLNSLRKDIYHKLVILPLSFYSKQKKGDIMNRIGPDVQEVEWSIISSLQALCRDPFLLIAYLIALLKVNTLLTLLSLVLLPAIGYLITIVGKSIQRNSKNAQQILGKMSSLFEETIGGLRIIKGYNATEYATNKFQKENDKHYQINKKIFTISELASPMVEMLSIITMILVFCIGGKLIFSGQGLNAQVFIMYILIFVRMLPPAKQLVTIFYTLKKGGPSTTRIYEIIDSEEIITENKNPKPITEFKDKIEYREVSFSYQPQQQAQDCNIIKGINFTLKKGEQIALVGASGCGKSTLVDLLPRFYDVEFGAIEIDGTNIKDFVISDLRALFGIVNQDITLFNDTVFNNITFGMENVTLEQVIQAAKIAHADEFIQELPQQYETVIGERGTALSGGQRQRLCIARAILRNPQILILDEATSALDNESELLVQQALDNLLKTRTAIIIAHRLNTIKNANKILFVKEGKITESGTHDELLSLKGDYFRYYSLQNINR